MLILAFESSAKAGSAALLENGILLGENYCNTGLTHSETLLPMAEALLQQCGRTVADVTHVAVAAGPGSFTGVRIGLAAAKGLSWGRELPCVGVSTLEAMALGFGQEGCICAVMDARRNQVYNALFSTKNGELTRLSPDRAIALAELKEELKALEGPIYLVGDGSSLSHKTLASEIPALVLPPEHRMHQRACGVALAAKKQLESGHIPDAAALVPNYLRLSQAERERLEKEKR